MAYCASTRKSRSNICQSVARFTASEAAKELHMKRRTAMPPAAPKYLLRRLFDISE